MALALHDVIKRDREAAFPDAKDITLFRDYFRGRQRGTHTTTQGMFLRGVLSNLFCDNVTSKIVNEIASRHELIGFAVDNETVKTFLDDLYVKNHLARLQPEVAVATLRDGNHALALRWQPEDPERPSLGRVTIHRERWWDGTSGVFVAYGADGEPAYAVKDWSERVENAELKRRVVWFPDHFERYRQDGDGWKPYALPGDPDGSEGRVSWVKRDGSPLGIPVVHFANGSDDDSPYGASELDGGVLGLQDEINDIHRDITATARLTGYQMYTATGTAPEKDEAGTARPLRVGPGQVLQSGDKDARYGVLPAGDLTQLKGALLTKTEAVFRMRDIPFHVITGQWPSGAALLRSEMPLVNRGVRLNNTQAPSWATTAHRSTEMANTFGEGDRLDESALITAEFAPPERLDALTLAEIDKARADALLAREMLQDRESLLALGLTGEEADGILRRRAERAEAMDVWLTGPGPEESDQSGVAA